MRKKSEAKGRNGGLCVLKPRIFLVVEETAAKAYIEALAKVS